MGFRMGIVGLPNVGKSTLFNALTRTAAAQAANFPFCTIEPNVGEVAVPDRRLERLAAAMLPKAVRDSVVEDEYPGNHPNLACVLFSGPPEERQLLRQQLAAREGEILSVIEPNADGGYPLYRLVKEKVVSVNTASAGGDAALMMLGNSLLQ